MQNIEKENIEKETRSTTYGIDGKRVKVTHWCATKNSDGVADTKFVTVFDFGKCTEAEILKMAAKNQVIAWRNANKVKDLTQIEAASLNNMDVDCSEVKVRVAKAKLSESDLKVLEASNGMSFEELATAIKEFKLKTAKQTFVIDKQ